MKLKYKIFIIVFIGTIFTIFISSKTMDQKVTVVAIGDGLSLGMTSYDMVGVSYNDYLTDDLEKKDVLQNFNNEYSIEHQTIEELYMALDKNEKGHKTNVAIKQTLAKAEVITLGIGMDEFVDYSIKNKLNDERIEKFLQYFNAVLKNIRSFYDKELIVISLYPIYGLDKNTIFSINQRILEITHQNKAKFLDIMALSLNPEYYADGTSYYMNYKGHLAIYKQLIKLLPLNLI